jgi:hypothetical protein
MIYKRLFREPFFLIKFPLGASPRLVQAPAWCKLPLGASSRVVQAPAWCSPPLGASPSSDYYILRKLYLNTDSNSVFQLTKPFLISE